MGSNIVSHLTESPDESNCYYKALNDLFKYLKGELMEPVNKTIENEYLVIDDELTPINDVQVIISSSNNIDKFHENLIETETIENIEFLPTDLLNDFDIINLSVRYTGYY